MYFILAINTFFLQRVPGVTRLSRESMIKETYEPLLNVDAVSLFFRRFRKIMKNDY